MVDRWLAHHGLKAWSTADQVQEAPVRKVDGALGVGEGKKGKRTLASPTRVLSELTGDEVVR